MALFESVNRFDLEKDDVLFFDIFYKNNELYLIMPIYNDVISSDDIKIIINNVEIKIKDKLIKNKREPICIYVYDCPFCLESIEAEVKYKEKTQLFNLKCGIVPDEPVHYLTLTTLFKNDFYLFPLFYKYYKEQGVSHFYMYYNGKITPEIVKTFSCNEVTLIEWDYRYWNNKDECIYTHHAQLGQMHHSIYKYGKDVCEYMIFCDLDEYLHTPNHNIKDFILNNKDIDVFGFLNKWSHPINDIIPETFPTTFLTSNTFNYGNRSKNIYKIDSIKTISIHTGNEFFNAPKRLMGLEMFHFYNWTNASRKLVDVSFSIINLNI